MSSVRSSGVSIHYETEGTGPALILHTGAGGDLQTWKYAGYPNELHGYRLILIDHRGHGQSGRPLRVEDHVMERYVEDVVSVMDDAHAESAGFWGYSAGFFVGVALAAAFPSRIRALVGTGAFELLDMSDYPPVPDREAFIAKIVAEGGVIASYERFMAAESDRFPDPIDRLVRETDPRMGALRRTAWRSWHGPKSLLSAVSAPVMILVGTKEDPDHATEKLVAALPRGRLVSLAGEGHLSAFYRSELALSHVRPFLREHLA
jgi:pimeloyl-ACP methyl ester carboxylesterase